MSALTIMNWKTPYPAVVALTWAKTSGDLIFSAMRVRFALFHAGVIEVKTQGVFPNSGSLTLSYQPVPKSKYRMQRRRILTNTESVPINWSPSVQTQPRIKGLVYNRMCWARKELKASINIQNASRHPFPHM